MEMLAALAQHRHFARAAEACGISQPAFSERIRNLEKSLGTSIVLRGNRFAGFTPEGEIALRWAHRMIADATGLRQEIDEAKGVLTGRLAIGVVPTALTYVANIAAELRKRHPGLAIQVHSRSADEIARGLEGFELDAGVTYLERALPRGCQAEDLFEERYELLLPSALGAAPDDTISWRAAADFPLCLLTPNMMNRQFIDEAFREAEVTPNVVMETNAFTAALVQVGNGTAATIASDTLAQDIGAQADVARLPLVQPELTKRIGIVTAERDLSLPAVEALLKLVRETPQG